ncbi:BAFF protein-like [Scleropages formosus]|uniref:BAFF protein-like n=1 Tax=Scleropages formosus TaxID=113540 RepID=A0A0P7WUV8_SCLFO|nr:BAFF protein-like [Scleropages formosus]
MSAHPGEPVLRSNPEVQQQRLPWALLLLTLAAITSWSLSVISLYHILTLKAEVAGLRAELGRRREEQRSMSVQRQGGPSQEPQTSKAKEVPCLQMMANSKKETTFQDEHTVIPWQVGLRRGTALEESNNTILVKEEGFYFVYSQVYYTDKTFAMGHFVIRRKQNVVGDELQEVILFRCIQTMNPIFPYNTCYTAGVVKLEVGDRVELLIPRQSANVSLDGDSTFLGAIKLV